MKKVDRETVASKLPVLSLRTVVPKNVDDLLHPAPPPPQEPHNTIITVLRSTPGEAFTKRELIERATIQLPNWDGGGGLFSSIGWAVGSALAELVGAGVVVEHSDGTNRYYYAQQWTKSG